MYSRHGFPATAGAPDDGERVARLPEGAMGRRLVLLLMVAVAGAGLAAFGSATHPRTPARAQDTNVPVLKVEAAAASDTSTQPICTPARAPAAATLAQSGPAAGGMLPPIAG